MSPRRKRTLLAEQFRARVRANVEALALWPAWLRESISTESIFPERSKT